MADKLPKAGKKTPRTQNSRKITAKLPDIFQQVCAQTLGVECVREHRFYKPRKWRFDYAIPQYRIAIEVEGGVWTGGRHTRPAGFLNDMQKYNTAALLGWRVFRCTPDKLLSESTIGLIRCAVSGSFSPGIAQK